MHIGYEPVHTLIDSLDGPNQACFAQLWPGGCLPSISTGNCTIKSIKIVSLLSKKWISPPIRNQMPRHQVQTRAATRGDTQVYWNIPYYQTWSRKGVLTCHFPVVVATTIPGKYLLRCWPAKYGLIRYYPFFRFTFVQPAYGGHCSPRTLLFMLLSQNYRQKLHRADGYKTNPTAHHIEWWAQYKTYK